MADYFRDFAQANIRQPSRSSTSPASGRLDRHTSLGGHLMPSSPPPLSTELRPGHAAVASGRRSSHGALSIRSPFGRRASVDSNDSAPVRTRMRRASTVKVYDAPNRPNFLPGAEPGIRTGGLDVEDDHKPHVQCDITVVDYCEEHVDPSQHDNASFVDFLREPRPDWVDVRWICVEGIDWGIIKELGNKFKLHPLAIEDLMSPQSRPKVDWYSDHAFIVLNLSRLIDIMSSHENDHDEVVEGPKKPFWQRVSEVFSEGQKQDKGPPPPGSKLADIDLSHLGEGTGRMHDRTMPRHTLQRWRNVNQERAEYMETKSPLLERGFLVGVEQVCLFLTADRTVITFFEQSAADILNPLSKRLSSDETILRTSADATLLVQAIIDAVVDLASPVLHAYDDAIGSLELEVLTDPDVRQPRELYVLTSEITLLRNTIAPTSNLIHSLREHRAEVMSLPARSVSGSSVRPQVSRTVTTTAVTMSALSHTYLSDVEDHVLTLSANLDRMRSSAEHLESLIFNTLSAAQSNSMKQLTQITIFFLPLTFVSKC